jgi:hypothetical protein
MKEKYVDLCLLPSYLNPRLLFRAVGRPEKPTGISSNVAEE